MKALKKDSVKLKADLRDKDAELKGKSEEIKHAITAKARATADAAVVGWLTR